jgi:hypothetical protein
MLAGRQSDVGEFGKTVLSEVDLAQRLISAVESDLTGRDIRRALKNKLVFFYNSKPARL